MDYLAVAIAGFFGAVTRAGLNSLLKIDSFTLFPLPTLIINLTGCFLFSLFMDLTISRLKINAKFRLAIATGFLGAYTTFSTFTLEAVKIFRNGHPFISTAYILLTVLGCMVLAWAGIVLSRVIGRPDAQTPESSG